VMAAFSRVCPRRTSFTPSATGPARRGSPSRAVRDDDSRATGRARRRREPEAPREVGARRSPDRRGRPRSSPRSSSWRAAWPASSARQHAVGARQPRTIRFTSSFADRRDVDRDALSRARVDERRRYALAGARRRGSPRAKQSATGESWARAKRRLSCEKSSSPPCLGIRPRSSVRHRDRPAAELQDVAPRADRRHAVGSRRKCPPWFGEIPVP
jgi:hypothetical protein